MNQGVTRECNPSFFARRAAAVVDRHGPVPDPIMTTLGDLPPLLA